MSRLLPSMSSLKVFEACSRHLNFSKAADELSLTQSAVSRQIMALEDTLGLKLFYRIRKSVVLTESGLSYASQVRKCIRLLENAATELLANHGKSGTLNLEVLSVFGTKWLIPRMPAFWQTYPHITVNLKRPPVPFEFNSDRFDAAILYGELACPRGFIAERLMDEEFVVACAPALLAAHPLRSIRDLAHHTLLQHAALPRAWQDWLNAAKGHSINGLKGPRFERFSLVLAAAIAKTGIALLPRFLVDTPVAARKVVICFDTSLPTTYCYHLLYPEEKKEFAPLLAFRNWLNAEAKRISADDTHPLILDLSGKPRPRRVKGRRTLDTSAK